jgi:hypothetical protein
MVVLSYLHDQLALVFRIVRVFGNYQNLPRLPRLAITLYLQNTTTKAYQLRHGCINHASEAIAKKIEALLGAMLWRCHPYFMYLVLLNPSLSAVGLSMLKFGARHCSEFATDVTQD